MSRLLIHNLRVLDPASGHDEQGGILIENGRILALLSEPYPRVEAGPRLDGRGLWCLPALIDGRGSGETPPLASGIVQTVNTAPVSVDGMGKELAAYGLAKKGGALLLSDGLNRTVPSMAFWSHALLYAKQHDLKIHALPFDASFTGEMAAGELATRQGLSGIPSVVEAVVIAQLSHLALAAGTPVHVAPITTAAGVMALKQARAMGAPMTADTALPYILFNELMLQDFDSRSLVFPPLRREEDRAAVLEALLDGTIDWLVSGHSPVQAAQKNVPLQLAAAGVDTALHLLPQLVALAEKEVCSLLDALALVTCKPAAHYGLAAGRLAVGMPADLCLFDPKSTGGHTGTLPCSGKVAAVVVGGQVVWENFEGETARSFAS